MSIASEVTVGSSLLQNSTATSAAATAVTSALQDTTQSSPKSPSSPLSPPPSDDHDTHRRQVFNTLFGNNEPAPFKNNSPFINDNDHMPVIATPAMSPSVSLSPHTPSNDNTRQFTADIILPESNDLVRAGDIEDDEITESFDSAGTTTPLATATTAGSSSGIVSSSNSSSNNKVMFRRTAEEYMSNR